MILGRDPGKGSWKRSPGKGVLEKGSWKTGPGKGVLPAPVPVPASLGSAVPVPCSPKKIPQGISSPAREAQGGFPRPLQKMPGCSNLVLSSFGAVCKHSLCFINRSQALEGELSWSCPRGRGEEGGWGSGWRMGMEDGGMDGGWIVGGGWMEDAGCRTDRFRISALPRVKGLGWECFP